MTSSAAPEAAGIPKAFGPPGSGGASSATAGVPKAFGPASGSGNASSSDAARATGATSGSAGSSSKAGASTATSSAASTDATRSNANSSTNRKPENESPNVPAVNPQLPVPIGTIVRLHGLKAQPELNGKIGHVLRVSEKDAERLVVRTRFGEKALKPANLQSGRSVLPKILLPAWTALMLFSCVAVADVFRTGGRSAYSVAMVPISSALWLGSAIALCIHLSWPGKTPGTWLPSVSFLSSNPPSRGIFRMGFVSASLLFGILVWLQGECIVAKLVEVPPSIGTNASLMNVTSNGSIAWDSHQNSSLTDASVDAQVAGMRDATVEHEEADTVADEANDTMLQNGTNLSHNDSLPLTNGTNSSSNESARNILEWAPEQCLKWGYAVSMGLLVQGIFAFDGRFSVQSTLHILGFIAFAISSFNHASISNMLLSSAHGKHFLEASSVLRNSVHYRRYIIDYVPILLLAAPLSSQTLNGSKGLGASGKKTTFKSVLEDSGMLTSARALQWISMLTFIVFYSSFGCDLWVAALA